MVVLHYSEELRDNNNKKSLCALIILWNMVPEYDLRARIMGFMKKS